MNDGGRMKRRYCRYCCPNPDCEKGYVYGAIYDEELGRWVSVDARCAVCEHIYCDCELSLIHI